MAKLKLTGKEIRAIGYPEGPVISIAMQVMEKNFKYYSAEEALSILKKVLETPAEYRDHEVLGLIAQQLFPKPVDALEGADISLNQSGISFNVFGSEHIEQSAMHQMYTAAKLPIAVAGALMPDAHHGYGLPIGGVLATENAVIPYGVGVDIGCRMCLSVFDIDPKEMTQKENYFKRELNEATLFGSGSQFRQAHDHEVMENKAFDELKLLKGLQTRAWKQLGSSGSGNHFVEFGTVEINEKDVLLNIEPGKYL
jgi:tRNA-splicing ligase RtcB (3'-phosphate/5'-hydroxy nucleic acid ligase)